VSQKKKTDIWMPLYIGEYLADTMHLTTEQSGAYLLLIMAYWRKKGPLPSNPAALAAICRLSSDAWSIHQAVLEEFFDTSTPGLWVHKRVEKELAEAGVKKERAEVKAKNAADARWSRENNATSIASRNAPSTPQAVLEECPSPSPSPTKKPIKEPLSASADVQAVFDYWRQRMNHPKAAFDDKRKKLIKKAIELGYTTTDLFAAIDGCAKSPFHMGQNDNNTMHDDLELILRNAGKIDGFIKRNSLPTQAGSANAAHKPTLTGTAARNSAVSEAIRGLCAREAGAGDVVSAGDIPDIADGDAGEVLEHVPD
jgi:uncharacterized protein YdaU (DUF1376 family)